MRRIYFRKSHSGRPAFQQLLTNVHGERIRVWATNSPFAIKDLLSRRGYKWGASAPFTVPEKAWFIELERDQYRAEMDWLQTTIYSDRPFSFAADGVIAIDRFSERRGESKMLSYGLKPA